MKFAFLVYSSPLAFLFAVPDFSYFCPLHKILLPFHMCISFFLFAVFIFVLLRLFQYFFTLHELVIILRYALFPLSFFLTGLSVLMHLLFFPFESGYVHLSILYVFICAIHHFSIICFVTQGSCSFTSHP